MALETATYISGLVSSNPPGTDPKSQGDDHIRLIKATLLNTFPNITGAVSATHTEMNYLVGVTSSIQTQLNSKLTSVSISQLTAAAANQTIDNTSWQLAWGWKLTGASNVALNLTESAASINGSGSQDLVRIGTTTASTANPINILSRGNTALKIDYLGAMTIATPTAYSAGNAPTIAITTGAGNTSGTGGDFSITLGAGASASQGGSFNLNCGTGAGANRGGDINITAGTGGSSNGGGGTVTISGATGGGTTGTGGTTLIRAGGGASSGAGGAITIQGGNAGASAGVGGNANITAGNSTASTGGDVTITTGTGTTNGKVNFVNTNVANGTVACVFTASVGPTGAGTNIAGWMAVKVNGTSRYWPYW